jgi:hypothetical protein
MTIQQMIGPNELAIIISTGMIVVSIIPEAVARWLGIALKWFLRRAYHLLLDKLVELVVFFIIAFVSIPGWLSGFVGYMFPVAR